MQHYLWHKAEAILAKRAFRVALYARGVIGSGIAIGYGMTESNGDLVAGCMAAGAVVGATAGMCLCPPDSKEMDFQRIVYPVTMMGAIAGVYAATGFTVYESYQNDRNPSATHVFVPGRQDFMEIGAELVSPNPHTVALFNKPALILK